MRAELVVVANEPDNLRRHSVIGQKISASSGVIQEGVNLVQPGYRSQSSHDRFVRARVGALNHDGNRSRGDRRVGRLADVVQQPCEHSVSTVPLATQVLGDCEQVLLVIGRQRMPAVDNLAREQPSVSIWQRAFSMTFRQSLRTLSNSLASRLEDAPHLRRIK